MTWPLPGERLNCRRKLGLERPSATSKTLWCFKFTRVVAYGLLPFMMKDRSYINPRWIDGFLSERLKDLGVPEAVAKYKTGAATLIHLACSWRARTGELLYSLLGPSSS